MRNISPKYNCEVLGIRERQNGPQLLASNRHISCGALEIQRLKAESTGQKEVEGIRVKSFKLSGESEVIGGEEPYILYLTEPMGYQMSDVSVSQGKVLSSKKEGIMRIVTIGELDKGMLNWLLIY